MMRRAYDLDAGIYDEEYLIKNPMALIGAHNYELNYQNGLEWTYMKQYVAHKIFDLFHISFKEFMSTPLDRVQKMIDFSIRTEQEKIEAAKAEKDRLESLSKVQQNPLAGM